MNEIEYQEPGSGGAIFAWIFASVIAWSALAAFLIAYQENQMTKPAAALIGALVAMTLYTAWTLWTVL